MKKSQYLLFIAGIITVFALGCTPTDFAFEGAAVEVTAEPEPVAFMPVILAESDISTPPSDVSWTDAWILNEMGETSTIFEGVPVNVTNVYTKTVADQTYQCITSSGVPNYETTVDQTILDNLMNRPKGNEFNGSSNPAIELNDVIQFGESIGYTPAAGCTEGNEGYGYWPFGPACPTNQEKEWCFPLDPEPHAEGDLCQTGLNQIGAWVNGVSIFNWEDGQSYNQANVWLNDAFHLEIYDLDICVGHAANGNYHHHSNPTCLGAQLGDDGSGPSPIYGFAADGYPIYGPYEAADTLVNSCWKTRDYSADSATGCGVDGERSCLLVDQYDITQGVEAARSNGPSTADIVTSMSGNPILAVSGAYFQDYYYDPDCTAQGHLYLDEHNGHFSEELGYHYHTTLVKLEDGTLDYAFPHYAGPAYAGVLQDDAIAQCSDGGMMPPPPPEQP